MPLSAFLPLAHARPARNRENWATTHEALARSVGATMPLVAVNAADPQWYFDGLFAVFALRRGPGNPDFGPSPACHSIQMFADDTPRSKRQAGNDALAGDPSRDPSDPSGLAGFVHGNTCAEPNRSIDAALPHNLTDGMTRSQPYWHSLDRALRACRARLRAICSKRLRKKRLSVKLLSPELTRRRSEKRIIAPSGRDVVLRL
jgi:hypothetical protein